MKDKDSSILKFGKLVGKTAPAPEENEAAEGLRRLLVGSREAMVLDVRLKDGTVERASITASPSG